MGQTDSTTKSHADELREIRQRVEMIDRNLKGVTHLVSELKWKLNKDK